MDIIKLLYRIAEEYVLNRVGPCIGCLLYTSDAADEMD